LRRIIRRNKGGATMRTETILKLGHIAGALLMAAGVTSCTMRAGPMALLFIAGGLLYAGCRLAAWLRRKDEPAGS
jgi:hypothetical protein